MTQNQDCTPSNKKQSLGNYISHKIQGSKNNEFEEIIKKLPNSEDVSKLMNLINENSSMKNKINYLENKIKKYEKPRTRLKPRLHESIDHIHGKSIFSTKTSSNMKVINPRSLKSCQSCKATTFRDLTTLVPKSESRSKSNNKYRFSHRVKTSVSKNNSDKKYVPKQSDINKIKANLSRMALNKSDIYNTIN